MLEWIGLGYFLPATPSKGRVYVWRRLRAMGAQVIRPGVAALPNSIENRLAFEALSEKITDLPGEALLIEFNFLKACDTESLREKFVVAAQKQIGQMLENCTAIIEKYHATQEETQRCALEEQFSKAIYQLLKTPLGKEQLQHTGGTLATIIMEMLDTGRSAPFHLWAEPEKLG